MTKFATFLKHICEVKLNGDYMGLVALLPRESRVQEAYSAAKSLSRI